jgi:hypothetical protein
LLFALALIDASIIGAAAVSLSSAYAVGDLLNMRHSLHESPLKAKTFYGIYCCLIALAAALVLVPGVPLGLLTNAVQTLAGVLLPSASVFLLLLCNDKELLGPWANSFKLNVFTSVVVGILVLLSLILTAAVLFPDMGGSTIVWVLGGGAALGGSVAGIVALRAAPQSGAHPAEAQYAWRAPRLEAIGAIRLTPMRRLSMLVLRGYLVVAVIMVIVRVAQTVVV